MKYIFIAITIFSISLVYSQDKVTLKGLITHKTTSIENATIAIEGTRFETQTDNNGSFTFQNIPLGT